jgi:non-ribosomal peptide synthase protein (TIGR01720 family)
VNAYPFAIESPPGREAMEAIHAVGRRLRSIPQHGLGYGLLRGMRSDEVAQKLAAAPQAETMFTYLGQLDQELGEGLPLRRADEPDGPAHCPTATRPYLLEIIAYIRDGRLHVQWLSSRNRHREETIRRLADSLAKTLRDLAARFTA